jgi:hypothetical protein
MTDQPCVPADFAVPQGLTADGFHLVPLGPHHNAADHAAWTSSISHIRATPGFRGRAWPPPEGMTLAENLADLERHAADFAARAGFTYSVLDDEDTVVGCVYIYPSRTEPDVTNVRSWVRADRADLDAPLYEAVTAWLTADWPFPRVHYRVAE